MQIWWKKLKKKLLLVFMALVAVSLFVAPAFAMVDKAEAFVCPVLGGQAGLHGQHNGVTPIAGGYYTHGGPDVSVPTHVPNSGWPGTAGSFGTPGDEGYTAIWDHANEP